jgi:hypothetical protein
MALKGMGGIGKTVLTALLIKLNLWSGFQKMEQRGLHFLCSSAVCHEVPSLVFLLSSDGLMPFLPNLVKFAFMSRCLRNTGKRLS